MDLDSNSSIFLKALKGLRINIQFPFLLLIVLSCLTLEANSQTSGNFEEAQISLLTINPGNELYSIFGHSAIRVSSPVNHIDWVYNYGTFNFDTPNFYRKFIEGNLPYSLSVQPFGNVMDDVILENRTCIETSLLLSPLEKQTLIKYLYINSLPENREYAYDFLYDNCSTRILDLLYIVTEDSVDIGPQALPHGSFRKLIHNYLRSMPWTQLGIDFLMGSPADRKATETLPMFLPEYLHRGLANSTMVSPSSVSHPLSKADIVLYSSIPDKKLRLNISPGWIFWPINIGLLLFLFLGKQSNRRLLLFDRIIFVLFGLSGLLLMALWIYTNHYIFRFNTDLFWANPLLLILALVPLFPKRKKSAYILFFISGLLVTIGIITSYYIEENAHLAALSVLLLLRIVSRMSVIKRVP